MTKTCLTDGPFEIYLWPSAEHYNWFKTFAFPIRKPATQTQIRAGCPHDCGLCPDHLRHPTLIEIEVTRRCNLACPVCFMAAGPNSDDPSLDAIAGVFQTIREQAGSDTSIQLTGGEPTLRADLADIIRCGRDLGFCAIEINTNGLTIAAQPAYLRALKEAGLTGVYLQFDGLKPQTFQRLRGADLLQSKLRTINNCRAEGVQVVLAATIVSGINDQELGALFDFALDNQDSICGLALQPAFESGRFEVYPERRLSMGDVVSLLVERSRGRLEVRDFWPLGCSHALCSCGTHLFRDGNSTRPITRDLADSEYRNLFSTSSPQGSVFADIQALKRQKGPDDSSNPSERGLSILIMNYMDAWTMDLERLCECSMTVATPDGRIIPFCAYHLTDAEGRRIYRMFGEEIARQAA